MVSEDVKIAIVLHSFTQSINQPRATTGFEVLNNLNVFKVFSHQQILQIYLSKTDRYIPANRPSLLFRYLCKRKSVRRRFLCGGTLDKVEKYSMKK
jgi:hypothetical protein